MTRRMVLFAATAAVFPLSPAIAQAAAAAPDSSAPQPASGGEQASAKPAPVRGSDIVVTGRRLDVARDSITPSPGASQYTFNKQSLEKQPGGTNLSLNKSLLQAPGVTQDSYG